MSTHSIAAHWKTELSVKLKITMFSLNADEVTNGNMNNIQNVLIRYFDEEMGSLANLILQILLGVELHINKKKNLPFKHFWPELIK